MRPVPASTLMLGFANFSAMSWFTAFILTTLVRPGHTAACPMRRAGTRTLQGDNHNTQPTIFGAQDGGGSAGKLLVVIRHAQKIWVSRH